MGRKKTITDEDLLAVARAVFMEEGFGASTKAIARQAGVSEGVIYQRFTTKDELFFAAMIPPVVDLSAIFQDTGLTGRELVQKLTWAMLDYCRKSLPVLLPLMAHPKFHFEEFALRHPESPLFVLRREITHVMGRERQAGRIGAVEPGGAALLIWSTAQSIAFFERLGAHGGRFDSSIIEMTVEAMWEGLAPRAKKK